MIYKGKTDSHRRRQILEGTYILTLVAQPQCKKSEKCDGKRNPEPATQRGKEKLAKETMRLQKHLWNFQEPNSQGIHPGISWAC